MTLISEGTLGGRRFAVQGKRWVCLECEKKTAPVRESFEAHECPSPASKPSAETTSPTDETK